MTTYKIVRFWQDENRETETIRTGLTLEEAQAHCNEPDTHGGDSGEGTAWFDGYTAEEED